MLDYIADMDTQFADFNESSCSERSTGVGKTEVQLLIQVCEVQRCSHSHL